MKTLLAQHNISEAKLKNVIELGAFPMPSMAITTDDIPFQNFGEITFVFKKSAVDPRASRSNDLFEADAYTCRFPRVLYEFDEEALRADLEETYHVSLANERFYDLNANVWYDLEDSVDVVYHILRRCGTDLSRDEISDFLQSHYKYRGIRKENVDLFTPSGARRSIKGLTKPYTIDNIMKAMKRGSGEEGYLTMHAWKGILANKLTSLSAIPNKFVEKEKAEELYSELEKEYFILGRKLFPVINKGYTGYSPTDMDDYLYEVRRPTPKAYKDMFARYDIEIEDELAEEITALAIKVQKLPVSYMEAKPHRIVDFSEAAAVIIPGDTSIKKEVRKLAEKNGIKIYEYENETERQNAVRECAADPIVTIKTF